MEKYKITRSLLWLLLIAPTGYLFGGEQIDTGIFGFVLTTIFLSKLAFADLAKQEHPKWNTALLSVFTFIVTMFGGLYMEYLDVFAVMCIAFMLITIGLVQFYTMSAHNLSKTFVFKSQYCLDEETYLRKPNRELAMEVVSGVCSNSFRATLVMLASSVIAFFLAPAVGLVITLIVLVAICVIVFINLGFIGADLRIAANIADAKGVICKYVNRCFGVTVLTAVVAIASFFYVPYDYTASDIAAVVYTVFMAMAVCVTTFGVLMGYRPMR